MFWYEIELSDKDIAEGKISKIQTQFDDSFKRAGRSKSMALFIEKESPLKKLYFSPIAALCAGKLIKEYNGLPCEKPDKNSLTLLVGSTEAWNILF